MLTAGGDGDGSGAVLAVGEQPDLVWRVLEEELVSTVLVICPRLAGGRAVLEACT